MGLSQLVSDAANSVTTFLDKIRWNLDRMWNFGVKWATDAWTGALAVVAFIYTLFDKLTEMIVGVVALIEGIVWPDLDPSMPGPVMEVAAYTNTFLPLSEMMVILSAYGLLLVALTIFKWVKIMVPTWGNT